MNSVISSPSILGAAVWILSQKTSTGLAFKGSVVRGINLYPKMDIMTFLDLSIKYGMIIYFLMIKPDPTALNLHSSNLESDVRRYFQDKAKRQPKRERTRAIILDGIVETIARYGLEGTTIREIIETAGVSHGTFYNHFENREEAIRVAVSSVATEIVTSIVETIKRLDKEDEAIVAATYAFMATAIRKPSWGKAVAATVGMLDATLDPSSEKLEKLIERGYSNGIFRVPVTPLLSQQVRAIQALVMSKEETNSYSDDALSKTCESILRLLGRTPAEAEVAVKTTLRKVSN